MKIFHETKIVNTTIIIIVLILAAQNFEHHRFNKESGVIEWDIKSYYAYLPATFIYGDLSFQFVKDNPEKFGDKIWPIETPTGKLAIVTSIGMSILYLPFFLLAHAIALIVPSLEPDGYTWSYRFLLTFSALFYVWLGMIFLVRILRNWFQEKVIAFTLIAIVLGTNLYYYTTYEAPMTHSYNFALITLFIWLTIRFYRNPHYRTIIFAGILAGFITLIRPTNIIVLIVFLLWDIKSWQAFTDRIQFFLKRWSWVILMALVFILVWVPQFAYWYYVSGKIFYFSYGEIGGKFFWHNPQIFNILFSYKKGWLVYTPLMLIALGGIFYLPKRIPGLILAVLTFVVLNIYIQSSWWSWWFGGGFGLRAFVDSYGLLAIPFAGVAEIAFKQKSKIRKYLILLPVIILILFNQFQTRQYRYNAIHWWWMNKDAYWETFLKLKPTKRYWDLIRFPDYEAARQGIYREIVPEPKEDSAKMEKGKWKGQFSEDEILDWMINKFSQDSLIIDSLNIQGIKDHDIHNALESLAKEKIIKEGLSKWEKEYAVSLIIEEIKGSPDMASYITDKAEDNNRTFDEQIVIDAEWLYENVRE